MTKRNHPVLYLSSVMDGATDQEKHSWREDVKRKWCGRCFDPTRRNLDPTQDYQEIVEADLRDIAKSDVVLVNFLRPSSGTAMEVYIGHSTGKLVVTIWDQKTCPVLSPWVRYFSHRVFHNIDSALEYIRKWAVEQERKQQSAYGKSPKLLRNANRVRVA